VAMNTIPYPAWREPYQAALREDDLQKLTELVREAEGAIFARMLVLGTIPDENDEQKVLRDACDRLFFIKIKILKWPDPYGVSQSVP
jgi:hypothetical protein